MRGFSTSPPPPPPPTPSSGDDDDLDVVVREPDDADAASPSPHLNGVLSATLELAVAQLSVAKERHSRLEGSRAPVEHIRDVTRMYHHAFFLFGLVMEGAAADPGVCAHIEARITRYREAAADLEALLRQREEDTAGGKVDKQAFPTTPQLQQEYHRKTAQMVDLAVGYTERALDAEEKGQPWLALLHYLRCLDVMEQALQRLPVGPERTKLSEKTITFLTRAEQLKSYLRRGGVCDTQDVQSGATKDSGDVPQASQPLQSSPSLSTTQSSPSTETSTSESTQTSNPGSSSCVLSSALQTLKTAVDADTNGDVCTAFDGYSDALDQLLLAISYETDTQRKSSIERQMRQYLSRAEVLKPMALLLQLTQRTFQMSAFPLSRCIERVNVFARRARVADDAFVQQGQQLKSSSPSPSSSSPSSVSTSSSSSSSLLSSSSSSSSSSSASSSTSFQNAIRCYSEATHSCAVSALFALCTAQSSHVEMLQRQHNYFMDRVSQLMCDHFQMSIDVPPKASNTHAVILFAAALAHKGVAYDNSALSCACGPHRKMHLRCAIRVYVLACVWLCIGAPLCSTVGHLYARLWHNRLNGDDDDGLRQGKGSGGADASMHTQVEHPPREHRLLSTAQRQATMYAHRVRELLLLTGGGDVGVSYEERTRVMTVLDMLSDLQSLGAHALPLSSSTTALTSEQRGCVLRAMVTSLVSTNVRFGSLAYIRYMMSSTSHGDDMDGNDDSHPTTATTSTTQTSGDVGVIVATLMKNHCDQDVICNTLFGSNGDQVHACGAHGRACTCACSVRCHCDDWLRIRTHHAFLWDAFRAHTWSSHIMERLRTNGALATAQQLNDYMVTNDVTTWPTWTSWWFFKRSQQPLEDH